MATHTNLARIAAAVAIMVASCGTDENVIPQDGPIENAAVEAGMTQAQGAPGADGTVFAADDLQIELDGEPVEIPNTDSFEELENFNLADAEALANCVALLNSAPSIDVQRCSYAPNAAEVIVDQIAPGECENGETYVTLNRIDGSGAYVGVVGQSWVELSEANLSLQAVELICEGATG